MAQTQQLSVALMSPAQGIILRIATSSVVAMLPRLVKQACIHWALQPQQKTPLLDVLSELTPS
jgi:hypothetical protein